MQKKLGSIFFMIPIGILVVSSIVVVILFNQAVTKPLHNIFKTNINESITLNLNEGDFVSLFINDSEIDRFVYTDLEEYSAIKYFIQNQSFIITVTIEDEDPDADHFDVIEITEDNAYRVDNYINYADVQILKDGVYTVSISSYDDINIGMGLIATDIVNTRIKLIVALVIGLLGFIGTIVSFVIIISKRGTSLAEPTSNNTDMVDNIEEEKEMEISKE